MNEFADFDFAAFFFVALVFSPPVYLLAVKWSKWNYRRYQIKQMEQQFEGENS